MKKPYRLKERNTKKGSIWYYKLPNETTFHSTGIGNRRLAEKYVVEAILGKKKPVLSPSLKTYALMAFNEYVKAKEARNIPLSEKYVKTHRRLIERFILTDQIADKRIGEIRLVDSERFETRLLKKIPDKQPTIELTVGVYRLIMRRAYQRGEIDRNPTDGMMHVQIKQRERSIYSLEEINTLFPKDVWEKNDFSPWQDEIDYSTFIIASTTGMRKGEILALEWDAVHLDEDEEYIEIRNSLRDNGEVGPPKSKRPRATPIFDFVFWADRRAVTALKKLRSYEGVIRATGPVFGYADGSLRKGTWWNSRLQKALKKAGINRDRGEGKLPLDGNSYRHTLASHLKSAGLPGDLIRQFCGWSSEKVQVGYTHIEPELFQRMMSLISRENIL